ncbi:MAG TPA: hypothetical protein VH681_03525, partial [Nitrospiraceae bacterium]
MPSNLQPHGKSLDNGILAASGTARALLIIRRGSVEQALDGTRVSKITTETCTYMSIKYVLITIVGCWLFLQISGLIWSSKGQQPSETLARLLEPPLNHIADPSRNGYFFLLGLTAAPSLDPAWVGYDIWHEADAKPVTATFDYEQPGRSDVRLVVAGSFLAPVWDSDDPFNELRQREASLRAAVNQFNVLLTRYERWLDMKFEDQGFGHRAVPRFEDVLLIHRLYLADGLSQRMALGMNRLQRDLTAWRTILREARTISLKVMAQVVIADDLKLLSKLFARPTVDKSLVPIATSLATPLTPSEYSLRWPVRSQLALGLHKERLSGLTGVGTESPEDMNEQWLLRAAAFAPEAFHRIDHPTPRSFLGIPLQTQRTWDTYA